MSIDNRLKIIAAFVLMSIIAVFSLDPIAQNPAYHHFADQRDILNISHFCNVISSLPFIIIGVIGMRLVASGHANGGLPELKAVYLTFFIGVFLIGFGSAYYHYHPDNQTLLWDRLPMTIAFMAFFIAVIGETLSPPLALKLLLPLLVLGIASVVHWHVSELTGHGDLRAYGLVQFLPVVLIPLTLWLFDSRLNGNGYIWGVIAAYAVSKLLEFFDAGIYSALGIISGHSLKHLIAALGPFIFYLALKNRQIRSS